MRLPIALISLSLSSYISSTYTYAAVPLHPDSLLRDDRPLNRARRRSAPEIIELSDSEPGNAAQGSSIVPKSTNTVAEGPKDPIVISSSSDGRSPLNSPSASRRPSAKKPQNKRKLDRPCSPPRGVDVITISDSGEDTSAPSSKVPIMPHHSTTRTFELSSVEIHPRVQEGPPAPDNSRFDLDIPEFHSSPIGTTHEEDMDFGAPATPPALAEPEPEPLHISSSISTARPEASDVPRSVREGYVTPQAAVDAIDRAFGGIDLELAGGDGYAVNANVDMDVEPSPPEHRVQALVPVRSPSPRTAVAAPQSSEVPPTQVSQSLRTVPKPPRTQTFVVPDISTFNVRFKRPESSQHSFFSRAFSQNATTQATSKAITSKTNTSHLSWNAALAEEQIPTQLRKDSPAASPKEGSSPGPLLESKASPSRLMKSLSGGAPDAQDTSGVSTGVVASHVESAQSTVVSAVVSSDLHSSPDLTSPRRHSEQSTRPPSVSTTAPQQLSTTPSPSILPPRRPQPLSGASLVDTLNKLRRDHLQSRQSILREDSGEPSKIENVEKLKSPSPAQRKLHSSSPMQSQMPPFSSQSQAQELQISPPPPSLDSIRSLSKRLSRPDSKSNRSELAWPPGSPPPAISSSSSSRPTTSTPPLRAACIPTSISTTTSAASTQTANFSASSVSTRRPLPVPFEGFISSPTTQGPISSQSTVANKSRTQQSPRCVSGASFESFIVKVPPDSKDRTTASEDAAVPRVVPRMRQMARKRTSQRPLHWLPPSQNVTSERMVAADIHGETDLPPKAARTSTSGPASSPVQRDVDDMIIDMHTNQPRAGVDADQLLNLADMHLKSSGATSHPEESPDVSMNPEVRYLRHAGSRSSKTFFCYI